MLICFSTHDRTATEDWIKQNTVSIEKVPEGWKIFLHEKEFDFINSKVGFYPDMANLCEGIAPNSSLYLNWASGNSNDKSGFFSCMFRNRGDRDKNFGAFFIDKTGESHFFTRYPIKILNDSIEPSYIEHIYATRTEDAFLVGLPENLGYKEWNTRHRAKINMLGHISLNDALTALEAQVDLQNRIIQKLVLGQDATSDLALLNKATDGVTVDTLHDDEKIVQTIKRQKNHIRKEQIDYFSKRGEAINADVSA